MTTAEHATAIDKAVFPGLQGGPHNHTTAGIAVALHEAAQPAFTAYAHQIVANAKALATALTEHGFDLVSGGTDNHLILIDLTDKGVEGKPAAKALDRAGIELNFNTVPYDPRKPWTPVRHPARHAGPDHPRPHRGAHARGGRAGWTRPSPPPPRTTRPRWTASPARSPTCWPASRCPAGRRCPSNLTAVSRLSVTSRAVGLDRDSGNRTAATRTSCSQSSDLPGWSSAARSVVGIAATGGSRYGGWTTSCGESAAITGCSGGDARIRLRAVLIATAGTERPPPVRPVPKVPIFPLVKRSEVNYGDRGDRGQWLSPLDDQLRAVRSRYRMLGCGSDGPPRPIFRIAPRTSPNRRGSSEPRPGVGPTRLRSRVEVRR